MHRRWCRIAVIAKAHGRRGQLVAEAAEGFPPMLAAGMAVAVLPPSLQASRYHTVKYASIARETQGQLIVLSGVHDLEHACSLVGHSVLVASDDVPSKAKRKGISFLAGRTVRDRRIGLLGEIKEVMVGAAQDIWVVRGPLGEVYVPAAQGVVVELPEEGEILIDLPDGIVGL